MLEIYTVSFFGHRLVENFNYLENQIDSLIRALLKEKEYVEFLVGRNGEFDQLVSSSIRYIKRIYRDDNSCHTLVLPYDYSEFRYNTDAFQSYYDQIDFLHDNRKVHYKAAIQERNRQMVDMSDLVVFYLEREQGGAYKTYQYAVKQNKRIIKLNVNNEGTLLRRVPLDPSETSG